MTQANNAQSSIPLNLLSLFLRKFYFIFLSLICFSPQIDWHSPNESEFVQSISSQRSRQMNTYHRFVWLISFLFFSCFSPQTHLISIRANDK